LDSNGRTTTGVDGSTSLELDQPPLYQFSAPTVNDASIPAVLSTNQTKWLCSYPPTSDLDWPYMSYWSDMGIGSYFDNDYNLYYTMTNDVPNYFGLPYTSATIAWGNSSDYTVLNAGGTVENVDGYFYPSTAVPKFHIIEYDFWPNPNWSEVEPDTSYSPVIPGMSSFTTTSHTNSLMITSVGAPYTILAYAKLSLTNSLYSGIYGYLGQYFTNAFQIDDDGNVTTNIAGMLSPYGQFFATQPGPAALLTMPDVDTGQQGTGVVNCIRPGDMQIEDGLAVGFVLGMQERKGFGLVLRA
jgi:hypothetical protein